MGTITLRDNRILSYAEYGNPDGTPVFFFHGAPGSRLLRPSDEVTARLGVHLITTDRPGFGLSTYKHGRRIMDWPEDIRLLADSLSVDTFFIAGYSGGGPYALACAYALPDRIRGTAILSGVGPAGAEEDLNSMTPLHRLAFSIGRYVPWPIWRLLVWYLFRMGHDNPAYLFERGAGKRPAADTRVLNEPGVLEMYYASHSEAFRQGTRGFALEARLVTRPWGFNLEAIRVPVQVWHGTADIDASVTMGKVVASRIPNNRLTICPDEGHQLLFPHWEEILNMLIKSESL